MWISHQLHEWSHLMEISWTRVVVSSTTETEYVVYFMVLRTLFVLETCSESFFQGISGWDHFCIVPIKEVPNILRAFKQLHDWNIWKLVSENTGAGSDIILEYVADKKCLLMSSQKQLCALNLIKFVRTIGLNPGKDDHKILKKSPTNQSKVARQWRAC